MPFGATWTTKVVTLTYTDPLTGTKELGTYRAELPSRVVNLTNATPDIYYDDYTSYEVFNYQVFRPGVFATGTLNQVVGQPSITLTVPVVDDPDNSPQGVGVTLTVNFASGGSETFTIEALTAWASTTDLADFAEISA